MSKKHSLVFFIPDTVRDVEILRIGSACYPHGAQGEPLTLAEAMHWAVRSEWGTEMLTSLGVTWTDASHLKTHRRKRMERFKIEPSNTRPNPLAVGVRRLHPDAVIPVQATAGDAGSDLYSVGGTVLYPGQRGLFQTGIALSIPEGYVGLIKPRSGLALRQGVDVLGGVIDAGYRGDVGVILINTGHEEVTIEAGQRIAQLVVQPVMGVEFRERELAGSERGAGGFGSTGTH